MGKGHSQYTKFPVDKAINAIYELNCPHSHFGYWNPNLSIKETTAHDIVAVI